jgi:hypothetical protein
VDNYGLTLVDLKNVGHKDDLWVLVDCVVQVFYVLDPEIGKHVVISGKQKIIRVENVEDNDEDTRLSMPCISGFDPLKQLPLKIVVVLW